MPLTALLTNCPDEETADTIASTLIATRLVACANRYAPIASMYRWDDDIEQDTEVPLLVKTRPELADRVAAGVVSCDLGHARPFAWLAKRGGSD